MLDYVKESVRFRMGDWYDKKFKLNEFNWDESINKNYISRKLNNRWKKWIDRFINCHGFPKNPGIILDSQDAFIYDAFIGKGNDSKYYVDCSPLEDRAEIPVVTHNRKKDSIDSILFCVTQQYAIITGSRKDPYLWKEKKNEIIWRGKFTGKNLTPPLMIINFCPNIEKQINEYHRFNCVKMWSKNYNIKFCANYNIEDKTDRMWANEGPRARFNLDYLDKLFQEKKHMVGAHMNFDEEICEYKYILSLDGNDWSSVATLILKSNSLMMCPIPKWHNIIHFKLEPWVHYVPLKDDTSDLEEKLEWCDSNQEECEAMVRNANVYMSYFNEDSELAIEKKILEKLYENAQ